MKLFSKFVAVCCLVFSVNAFALSEGVEYTTLKTPIANANKSVVKVFSYRCSHCYDHEKAHIIEYIAKKLPNLKYDEFSVASMGDYGKQAAEVFAVLKYLDAKDGKNVLDKKSKFRKATTKYFNDYFKKNKRWGKGEKPELFIKIGLKAAGVSLDEFNNLVKTPEVQQLINDWKVADEISKIQGTPGYVVNGKYLVMMAKVQSPDHLVDIIKELSEK